MTTERIAEHVKSAYWVPNVSGGLVTSDIEQRTTTSPSNPNHARDAAREVKFGLNGFIIARDTEAEAKETLREIVAKANRPAVEGFRALVQQAGNSTADKRGMWADSSFEDLVQYNDGFRAQLTGTPEPIAERIAAYRKRGVDLILAGFLHFQEEIEYFGSRVLPLVREIENAEDHVGRRSRAGVRLTQRA